jgi:aryl-alcohol dehydrogenase-like predicted oxidoreductase
VNDVSLGPLGVGTWAWGDREFWGYGLRYGEAEVRQAFSASIEAGIRLFDTAEIYGGGEAERILGRCIRATGQQVDVATKFFPFPWRLVRHGSVLRALRASLERLGLQQVALYQVHWPVPVLPASLWVDELAEAVKAGMAQAIGVSNFNVPQMLAVHEALNRRGVKLASNQVHYSLLHRQPERNGLLRACRDLDVRAVAHSPLEQGLLGGRYSLQRPPPGIRRVPAVPKLRRAAALLSALQQIGEAHRERTPAQVALNWLIAKGTTPIPGAKSAAQAKENAGALGWQLTAEELQQLDRLSQL